MNTFTLTFKTEAPQAQARPQLAPTQVGCVASGDLEVMIEPHANAATAQADVNIQSSGNGAAERWTQIFQLISQQKPLPAMRMDIHDFAATPGVIRLRIEQALEIAQTSMAQTATVEQASTVGQTLTEEQTLTGKQAHTRQEGPDHAI